MADSDTFFVGMPRHDMATLGAFFGWQNASAKRQIVAGQTQHSVLPHAFNCLVASALNMRRTHGVTHFAMLHADVEPEAGWVDVLIDELNATGADVISAIVPLKSPTGLTSTAIGDAFDAWKHPRRLTMKEVYDLPETFDRRDLWDGDRPILGASPGPLLVNTGCMAFRLDSWVEQWALEEAFGFATRIVKTDVDFFIAECVPEDWAFSRWLDSHGHLVAATRKVRLAHRGSHGYTNTLPWGTMERDEVVTDSLPDSRDK